MGLHRRFSSAAGRSASATDRLVRQLRRLVARQLAPARPSEANIRSSQRGATLVMQNPDVSVGMPVYNAAAWLEASIRCILEQSFANLELILSDNASTDASPEICARFASADSRVRFVRQPRNVGANQNYLFVQQQARGKYFKWASSNDLCEPAFLQRCIAALEQEPDAVLAAPAAAIFQDTPSDAQPYEQDLRVTADSATERLRQYFAIPGLNNAINGVFRLAPLQACLPLGVFNGADIVLMAELAVRGKMLMVPERLFLRRVSPAAATSYRSKREAELHLAPESKRPLRWQNWTYHARLVRGVARAARPGREWLRCVEYAMRAGVWSRKDLLADVRQALGGS
jgi:glycosyltransferase involved in cell wall biosynthesis